MQQNSGTKYFTRGGQITFHNLRMLLQINKTVGHVYLMSLTLLTAGITYLITPKDVWISFYYFCYSKLAPLLKLMNFKIHRFVVPYMGTVYHETPKTFLSQWEFVANAHRIYHYIFIGLGVAFGLSVLFALIFVKWLTNQGKKQTEDRYVRGSKLDVPKNVAVTIRGKKQASDIKIDGFPLLKDTEVQHFLLHGTTGAGKSQLIMKILDCLRKRGDKVILYDKGCTYTSVYYREGTDRILNPFDERCENWDLWLEGLDAPGFENMAESLIPLHGETDPFWVSAARTIFSSATFAMQKDSERSVEKLLQLILTSELEDLEGYLAGTEAATLVSNKIEKTAISIRSIITTYLKSLRFMCNLDGEDRKPFAIRDWIMNEDDRGWLFISSNGEQHAALKPLISMWLAMASIALLSLPENRNRRIWFICDELPTLHKLPQLPETIAEVRKFGGCFILGMQSVAQLEQVYGRNYARAIFDLLNTRFFFRSPSSDMAKLVSRELGEQEIENTRENYSYGANQIRDGISIGSQLTTKPIVVYPEIMELEDLRCFLRLPGEYPVVDSQLKYEKRKKNAAGFLKREIKFNIKTEQSISNKTSQVAGNRENQKAVEDDGVQSVKDITKDEEHVEEFF